VDVKLELDFTKQVIMVLFIHFTNFADLAVHFVVLAKLQFTPLATSATPLNPELSSQPLAIVLLNPPKVIAVLK